MDYFIDTNIFLRVLIKEDEKTFKDCRLFLDLVRQNKIKAFTSSLVLAEIDWVLESFYKFSKEEVIKSLESISRLKGLKVLNGTDISLALEFYKGHNIKFIDALIASHLRIFKKGMTVASYDRDFDKLKIIRREPREILLNFGKNAKQV